MAQSVLYTTAQGDTSMAIATFKIVAAAVGVATFKQAGNMIATDDGAFIPAAKGYIRNVKARAEMVSPYKGQVAYIGNYGDQAVLCLASQVTFVPDAPTPPPAGDCAAAIEARDDEWRAWLTPGG